MNCVLEEIVRTGTTELPDGRIVKTESGVGLGGGRVLRNAVQLSRPQLGCEIGLAYGLSTLHILDAMQQYGGGRLIGIDPAQHDDTWMGGGLHNVRRAGFQARYEFYEDTSQRVLPKLADRGTRIQFAFLDGWHTFDHTLVDFFYLDSMLDVGGILVLDDVGYPGLQRLAHFIVCNRDYSIADLDSRIVPTGWRVSAKAVARRLLLPLVRDNQSPSPANRQVRNRVNSAGLIALLKNGPDCRSFDHFVPF